MHAMMTAEHKLLATNHISYYDSRTQITQVTNRISYYDSRTQITQVTNRISEVVCYCSVAVEEV